MSKKTGPRAAALAQQVQEAIRPGQSIELLKCTRNNLI